MRCPTCHKETLETDKRYRPFCSERCKMIDLDNWLSERYRIPIQTERPDEDSNSGETGKGNKGESD